MKTFFAFTLTLLVLAPSLASGDKSQIMVWGKKFPNPDDSGTQPIITEAKAFNPKSARNAGAYTELLPYVLSSPDQEEAGSCLYMSLTGAAEWWLARLNPTVSRAYDGPLDLSERYLMNIAGLKETQGILKNWKTDTILALNQRGVANLNKDYRFTKGWYKKDPSGRTIPALPNSPGASYDTTFNWINGLDQIQASPIRVPSFSRDILFEDPASDQWNVAVAPKDIVTTVKNALLKNKAPVQVIYNHMGYWHSVLILGFNDQADNGGCPFVEKFLKRLKTEIQELENEIASGPVSGSVASLQAQITKKTNTLNKVQTSYAQQGGCNPKGVFYVRDSIYENKSGPMYDYDPSQTGEESLYTLPIIEHEYEWLTHLSNHVMQIFGR